MSELTKEITSRVWVGVAVPWPKPGAIGSFGRWIFLNVVKTQFTKAGLGATDEDFGFVVGDFIVVTVRVADRNRALRELKRLTEDLWLAELAEIAYEDEAEGYWRTVFGPNRSPFERFLTEEKLQASMRELQEELAVINAAKAAHGRRLEND